MNMVHFYRTPVATGESFILGKLNLAIEKICRDYFFSMEPGHAVLDVGCGHQPLRQHFEDKGFLYQGLDYKQNESGTVDFVTLIDQPFNADKQYDVIICTEVLEHVFDWDCAFKNFEHILKDNGLILITCPMVYPLHEEPYDYWRPTPFAIRRMAEKFGFSIVKEERVGGGAEVLGTLLSFSYFYPTGNTIKQRLFAKLAVRLRTILLKNLNQESTPVMIESNFFMSNLFLLRKTGHK